MNLDDTEKLLREYGAKLLEGFEGEVSDETMNTLRDMMEESIAQTLEEEFDMSFEATTTDPAAWDAVSSQPIGEVLVLKEGKSINPRKHDERPDSLLKYRGILPKEDANEQKAEEET